jgi:Arc/MetJ-type ribon-helix-helix transcriptional regulator
MVKMLSFQVEDNLAEAVDDLLKKGFYSSRSEFIKESIRAGIEKQLAIMQSFQKVHNASEKLRNEFKNKNMKLEESSKKERIELANAL